MVEVNGGMVAPRGAESVELEGESECTRRPSDCEALEKVAHGLQLAAIQAARSGSIQEAQRRTQAYIESYQRVLDCYADLEACGWFFSGDKSGGYRRGRWYPPGEPTQEIDRIELPCPGAVVVTLPFKGESASVKGRAGYNLHKEAYQQEAVHKFVVAEIARRYRCASCSRGPCELRVEVKAINIRWAPIPRSGGERTFGAHTIWSSYGSGSVQVEVRCECVTKVGMAGMRGNMDSLLSALAAVPGRSVSVNMDAAGHMQRSHRLAIEGL